MSTQLFSFGLGVGNKNSKGEWLDVFYPQPLVNPSSELSSAVAKALSHDDSNQAVELSGAQLKDLETALRAAKHELDPAGILNPGVLL